MLAGVHASYYFSVDLNRRNYVYFRCSWTSTEQLTFVLAYKNLFSTAGDILLLRTRVNPEKDRDVKQTEDFLTERSDLLRSDSAMRDLLRHFLCETNLPTTRFSTQQETAGSVLRLVLVSFKKLLST